MPGSPAAYLRVYEPLGSFPTQDRSRWERYVRQGAAPDRDTATSGERAQTMAAVIAPSLDVAVEHALVKSVDGLTLVCPLQLQLRVWEAAVDFRDSLPGVIAAAFVPTALTDVAERDLGRWKAHRPGLVSHVLMSTWTVPM